MQSVSLLKLLADAGLMNEKLNLVHGVWLTPDDIAQLADAGARVVHNPISNLKLKSGVAPILDLYRAGIEVALGCDNYSCAETQNIFIAMRMLCLLPAVTDPEPGPINAAYALRAATVNGARAVGLGGQAGALKPGLAADLAILDLNEPAFVPFNSAARQIVFAESGRAVETVFVAGRPVVRNGQAGYTRRGRARRRSGGNLAGVPQRCRGAGQPQQRPDRAAAQRQPQRVAGSTRLRALHRTRQRTLRHGSCFFSRPSHGEKPWFRKTTFPPCCCQPH